MKLATVVLLPLFAGPYVAAHGILRRISIQGKNFEGNKIGSNGPPSVIRQVTLQDPIKGAGNQAVTCGTNAQPAALVADANSGDTITFDWRTASDGNWPHNIGPMLTYMASCGSVSCDKFDQANARWFKIDQVGKKNDSDVWFQDDLMKGQVASVRIPSDLSKGNYLLRHEIIALHLAPERNGAEFYAGCAQLRVEGTGTGVPTQSELVQLPGAYTDDDPGIHTPNVFTRGSSYDFPGPDVASLAAVAAAGTPAKSAPLPGSPPVAQGVGSGTSSAAAAASPSASPVKKICNKKKKKQQQQQQPRSESVEEVAAREVGRPRRISHVMRRMAGFHRSH